MSSRTRDAGATHRSAPQAGFTLIELVVVVAILGVLAAIAVPTFSGLQGSAKNVAVQSDLVNGKTALTAFAAAHDGDLPSAVSRAGSASWRSTTIELAQYGWSLGSNTTDLAYAPGSGSSWCLLATSVTGAVFRVTPSTPVVRASSCA